jgi:hypothetical protein
VDSTGHALDETRQKPTLTVPQEKALVALLRGQTLTEAATTAGVSRQTVSEWLHRHPSFAAQLTARRLELREGIDRGLETAGAAAVRTLVLLMDDDDSRVCLAAARTVLELLRVEVTPPVAPEALPAVLEDSEGNGHERS